MSLEALILLFLIAAFLVVSSVSYGTFRFVRWMVQREEEME